jgi:hypothetical protein
MALQLSVSGNPNFYVGSVGTVTIYNGPANATVYVTLYSQKGTFTQSYPLNSNGYLQYSGPAWTETDAGTYTVQACVGTDCASYTFTVSSRPVVTATPTITTSGVTSPSLNTTPITVTKALQLSVSGNPNFYVGSVGTVTIYNGPANATVTVTLSSQKGTFTKNYSLNSNGYLQYSGPAWTETDAGTYTVQACVGTNCASYAFEVVSKTTTTTPTITTTTPPPPSYTTRVRFTTSDFYVGSSFTVEVTGRPNSDVTADIASSPNNAFNAAAVKMGTTNNQGVFNISGSWPNDNTWLGYWSENWSVAGSTTAQLNFTLTTKPVILEPTYNTNVVFSPTPDFYVGSSYTVRVTGKPNSAVTANIASSPNSAFNAGALLMGTTDNRGVFTKPGSWPNDNTWIGNWSEYWSVTGSTTAQLNFTLAAQPIVPPAEPPIPAPVSGNIQLTLNQNQQAVAFTYPGTVVSPGTITGVQRYKGPSHGTTVQVSGINYTYTPDTDYSGTDQIPFRLFGAGGLSNNTGYVNIQVDALPIVVRPKSFTFSNYSNQISNTAVTGSSVTLSSAFPNTYTLELNCVADSAGSASTTALNDSYVTGWTRNRGGNIQNSSNSITVLAGDIVTPVVRSAPGSPIAVRTLTFTVKLTGSNVDAGYIYSTNFTVSTAVVDLVPDVLVLYGATNLELSSAFTTNTVTVGGLTSGFPVPIAVSPTANLIIGGIDAGDSSTISNGQTLAVRANSSAVFSTGKQYTVTVTGTNSSNNAVLNRNYFTLTTRNPHVGPSAPWYFGNQVGLNPSTVYDTGSVTFSGMEESAVFSINNGGLVVVNNNTGAAAASATINNGDTVYFRASSASTFSTLAIYTVTLSALNVLNQTDSFSYTTRDSVNTPTFSGVFATLTQAELSSVVVSNTITATQFDGTQTITLSSNLANPQLVINGVPSGTSASISSGNFLAISGTTPADYYQQASATVTVSAATLNWAVVTKSNDDLQILNAY